METTLSFGLCKFCPVAPVISDLDVTPAPDGGLTSLVLSLAAEALTGRNKKGAESGHLKNTWRLALVTAIFGNGGFSHA